MHTLFASTAAVLTTALLAACSPQADAHARNAFPMGVPDRFDQPYPSKPLFSDPIVTAHSVLPQAKAQQPQALPPQAALPQATHIEAAPANTGDPQKDGAVNPAAGQAAAISDGQGEGGKHELGASK